MPRGDKSRYTEKQKRKAEHIEEGYEERGVGKAEAERRAWATVNKESGGGNKSGSGRGVKDTKVAAKRGGRIGGPRGGRAAAARAKTAKKTTRKSARRTTTRKSVRR
jgi:plasmid stabilization system protein ParE